MITYELEEAMKISQEYLWEMSLLDIINSGDRNFKVLIDGKVFFEEPYFPILEFIQYSLKWMNHQKSDFIYNSIESEENPLIAFYILNGHWKIYSVWQKFECNRGFSDDEVKRFIGEIISQIVI